MKKPTTSPDHVMERVWSGLRTLQCPFLANLNGDMVLQPGPPRIRLLDWLVKQFYGEGGLDLGHDQTESEQVLSLTKKFHHLGLCTMKDTDLIRGVGVSLDHHVRFFDELVDLAIHYRNSVHDESMTDTLYESNMTILNKVCEKPDDIFSTKCRLFSTDIILSRPSSQLKTQDLNTLKDMLSQLKTDFVSLSDKLKDMRRQASATTSYEDAERLGRDMKDDFDRFCDLSRAFVDVHEKEIENWTHMPAPPLTGVGELARQAKAVYGNIQELINSVEKIRGSSTALKSMTKVAALANAAEFDDSRILSLREEIAVLQKSVQRMQLAQAS